MILQSVESFQKENKLSPLPIILCGYVHMIKSLSNELVSFQTFTKCFFVPFFHSDSLATGMEAKEDMFTSSLDLRVLCPLMTPLISTLMQMLTRSAPWKN